MNLIELELSADFLYFIYGIFWLEISGYIQKKIATCNPKLFGLATAILFFIIVNSYVS